MTGRPPGGASQEGNLVLIRGFYRALDRGDGETMAAAYRPDARFRDPAFGQLSGERAGAMWRFLTARSEDLSVELLEAEAGETTGAARWVARYTFTPTGRRVTNNIRASFRFDGGLISEHTDRFSFFRWSRQALGPLGLLLGWSPLLRLIFRRRARRQLDRWLKKSAKSDEDVRPGS